jgi:hypothetical protein
MRVNVAEPHEPEGGEHENPDPAPKPGPTSPPTTLGIARRVTQARIPVSRSL